MRRLSFAAAILAVIAVYAFFGSIGTFDFRRVRWDQAFGKPAEGYYASLAEGFLRGQPSMAHVPDPRLAALKDPYDFDARDEAKIPYLRDASYRDGCSAARRSRRPGRTRCCVTSNGRRRAR
jgi:hypothetical protein